MTLPNWLSQIENHGIRVERISCEGDVPLEHYSYIHDK
jgi:hypothetical protein